MNYQEARLAILETWIRNAGGTVPPISEANYEDRELALLRSLASIVIPGGVGGGPATWGAIAGSLGAQTDLAAVLAGKANQADLTAVAAATAEQLSTTSAETIVATHTFNPATAGPPFVLGPNAQNQLVPGLNAALLNGSTAAQLRSTETHKVYGAVSIVDGASLPVNGWAELTVASDQYDSDTVRRVTGNRISLSAGLIYLAAQVYFMPNATGRRAVYFQVNDGMTEIYSPFYAAETGGGVTVVSHSAIFYSSQARSYSLWGHSSADTPITVMSGDSGRRSTFTAINLGGM